LPDASSSANFSARNDQSSGHQPGTSGSESGMPFEWTFNSMFEVFVSAAIGTLLVCAAAMIRVKKRDGAKYRSLENLLFRMIMIMFAALLVIIPLYELITVLQ
jgi:ABC-type maltose transport system permease subunit